MILFFFFTSIIKICFSSSFTSFQFLPQFKKKNISTLIDSYREFTLKESFWFALTSFTPQGGGEAPKALSSRTLVAAYWLFVVLMLATFTANLAAFLTVERMQVRRLDPHQPDRLARIRGRSQRRRGFLFSPTKI